MAKNKITLISHFYNEEFLLPYWLYHCRTRFDHGVMINYASTDNSVDIIKHICPTWKIVDSVNTTFSAQEVDDEVMSIEAQLPSSNRVKSWKTVLNTTEFVIFDRDAVINSGDDALYFETIYTMIDVAPNSLHPLMSLPLQKKHGILETTRNRHRLIHCLETGMYNPGRHTYRVSGASPIEGSLLLNYRWSPWPQVIKRRVQIQERVPVTDLKMNRGIEHVVTAQQLSEQYEELKPQSERINGL